MLGFLNLFTRTQPARPRPTPRRSTRLWLEQLETRDCPSAPGDLLAVQPPPPTVGLIAPAPAPVITLSLAMNGLKSVTLTGTVTADNPAGLTVTFLGAVSASTTTDNNGKFSLTINADSLGTVQATTVDDLGRTSNTATATVAAAPPVVTLQYTREPNTNQYAFWGTVVAPNETDGLWVTIQGAPAPLQQGVKAPTDENGNYATVVTLTPGQIGAVGASCVDCWGQQSNVAVVYIS